MLRPNPIQFAGRIGANQESIVDRTDPSNSSLLDKRPDAAPRIPVRDLLSVRGFRDLSLWKAAVIEGVGTLGLCYITMMMSLSPSINVAPLPQSSSQTAPVVFIGPLIGAIANVIILGLYITAFGPITGGHINPLVTMATFFARLTSFSRAILYLAFQLAGSALAGLLVRASYGSKHFKVGGCFRDPNVVSTGQAFAMEFATGLAIIFIAFGVGLDPRQASILPNAVPPIFVGFTVGVFGLATAYAVPGYGGASINPARCFAAFVGTGGGLGITAATSDGEYTGPDGSWHWIHWVGPLSASVCHAIFYFVNPPWSIIGDPNDDQAHEEPERSGGTNV